MMTFKQRLQAAMEQSVMKRAPVTSNTGTKTTINKQLVNVIKAEMALFDNTGKRGSCLQAMYLYLLTVPPTSVKAERAFSAAGIFVTDLRSHLSDHSIDALCFLRAFYGRNRAK